MEKIKFTTIIFIIILCVSKITLASSASVQFKGANEVVTGEDNITTIQIQNSEAVGVIEGVISYDSNIKDLKISSSYNGWTITYNETTGKFNAFKAEGTSNGEALQITYKLSENASQGTITLKNIELTTISYDTIKIENNITKTVTKITQNSNQNGSQVENNNNQNNSQILNNNKNGTTTQQKNATNLSTKNQIVGNKTSKTTLPKTGDTSFIIITIIIALIIIALVLYKKVQYYKEIK